MNYADIKSVDVANGLGVRVSIFVSGCNHACKGCFNQEAWDFEYGKPYTKDDENTIISLLGKPYIRGLSILGGEPLDIKNQREVRNLVQRVVSTYNNKDIWIYTGYMYEDLLTNLYNEDIKYILNHIDVLVDGKFELEKKDLQLKFRGSSNQRVIDIKKSNINEVKLYL